MPSPWSSLSPILSIKRAFSSHRSKKAKDGSRSSRPPDVALSSLHPMEFPSPPASSQSTARFSRRDAQLRTRKYLNLPPNSSPSQSVSSPITGRRSQSPSTLIHRTPITPTQEWPSPSTLLQWMEPSLKERREEGRRLRRVSEGNLTPARSSFYSSDSIPLPTRLIAREEVDGRGRGTTERVAAWIRSKSKERVDRVDQEEWKRTNSDRWRKRVPVLSSRSRSIDSLCYSMPAAAGCTNCMTKYSLLNREEGCSGCALSFCKKCVRQKAIIPLLSPNPLSVCASCFERIEREKRRGENNSYSHSISSTPLYPSMPPSSTSSISTSYFHSRPIPPNQPSIQYSPFPPPPPYSSHPLPSYSSNLSRPWWNDNDLPPPSMRSEYGRGVVQSRPLVKGIPIPQSSSSSSSFHPPASLPPTVGMDELSVMEERAKRLRDDADVDVPSLCSIEERLAAVRGVDVELVRNPRSYFEKKSNESKGDTIEKLMEEARSMAILEEKNDPDRVLEERANRLMERKEEDQNDEVRLSMAPSVSSRVSEFSEATKEELVDIDRIMTEAKKRVEENERRLHREMTEEEERKGDVSREMGEANRLARVLSLDVAKVNEEMAAFWQKENGKIAKVRDSSSDEELDEETLVNIVREAELASDEPNTEKNIVNPSEGTPEKKKGLFGRVFKK